MAGKIAAGVVFVTWGLWFGGMGALFLFVARLFSLDHDLAVKTAPQLFTAFEKYQMYLGAIAVFGAGAWRLATKNERVGWVGRLLMVALIGALLGPSLFMDRMLDLWSQGETMSPEFHRLHKESMMLFSGQMLILLIAGLALPWAMGGRNGQEREGGV